MLVDTLIDHLEVLCLSVLASEGFEHARTDDVRFLLGRAMPGEGHASRGPSDGRSVCKRLQINFVQARKDRLWTRATPLVILCPCARGTPIARNLVEI